MVQALTLTLVPLWLKDGTGSYLDFSSPRVEGWYRILHGLQLPSGWRMVQDLTWTLAPHWLEDGTGSYLDFSYPLVRGWYRILPRL